MYSSLEVMMMMPPPSNHSCNRVSIPCAQGQYVENNFEQFVIWSEALESMIHGALESGLELRKAAEKEIPFWAKEEDGVTDIFVVKSLYKCSSCSLVNGDDSELSFLLHIFSIWGLEIPTLSSWFLFWVGWFSMEFPVGFLSVSLSSTMITPRSLLFFSFWFVSPCNQC